MEGGPAACYLTGAMNSLLNKLHKLEMNRLLVDAFLPDLESLRKDLQDSFSGGPATGEQLKVWRKQVRELVYDMEDWIDPRLAAELGESETEQTQIEIFKTRIQEARGRCRRYDLLNSKAPNTDANLVDAAPSHVTVDPGLLWEEEKKKNALVGMDGPRRDLEKDLNDKRKKMKVVSIVGEGGHGKTTLAKEMYQKFKGQFHCQAFLSLHGNTFTRTTLLDILHQVNSSADDAATSTWDEQRVITELWDFLRTKRYFIIIDDIRSTSTWKVISGALPFNNHGSRILTTTCSKDVAISCSRRPSDVVYQMKDLGEEDSKKLLGSMISAPKKDRPVDLEEVSGQVLKVCGGIPFAIILTAALLDWKSAQLGPRKKIKKSILPLLDQHAMSAAGTRKTLEMSFDDLPMPLKSCFLYMSVFPENGVVKKDSLIRRWIAEGFICKLDGESLLETGENYFNELVSRKLIHQVFHIADFQPIGCTVHGVVADFIKSLSSKENFVTTGEELSSGSFPRDTTRRFLLDCSGQREAGGTVASIMVQISRARTLTVVGDVKEMSDLSAFRLVRVLDLEDTRSLRNDQLKGIGCLVLLKYLGLAGTSVTKLPEEIIALRHLETLDIRRNGRLQNFEALNAKLVSLLADDVQLPSKMVEALQRLEELSTVLIDGDYKPEDAAQLVSKFQQLKVLSVRANRQWEQRDLKLFFQALKDSKLMSLTLDCSLEGLDNWTPSSSLRRFQLKRFLSSVPRDWVSLDRLTHLDIRIGQVEPSDAVVLGRLPTLILLKLDAGNYSPEGRVTIDRHGFRQLKVAWFLCHSGAMGLQLEFGAMKQLQRLRLDFNVRATRKQYGNKFDFGIQFARHLREVHVTVVNCSVFTIWDVLTAEDAIEKQVNDNPGNPYLEIVRDGEPLPMDKEKQASPSGVKSKPAERFQRR